jgi:hypothetical protein
MKMVLRPFGYMRVFPGPSSQHEGPIAFRSASRLDRVEWQNDVMGDVKLHFGMGSYLVGEGAAHISIRMALQAADGTNFFFEYISRGDMPSHSRGETPVYLAGQIEIDPRQEKYGWLSRVQIVGRGMLTHNPTCQTYEMAILTEESR